MAVLGQMPCRSGSRQGVRGTLHAFFGAGEVCAALAAMAARTHGAATATRIAVDWRRIAPPCFILGAWRRTSSLVLVAWFLVRPWSLVLKNKEPSTKDQVSPVQ